MNWTHVLLAGYVGVIIAIVVGVFRKKGWLGKVSALVVIAAAIVVWNIFDVYYLIPRGDSSAGLSDEQQFDATLAKMPTFSVLKEQEPTLWQHIRDQTLQMRKEGKSEQQIIDAIQPQVLQVQMSRLQQAPDADVVNYMKINMEQVAAVQKQGDDACFRFLFPAVKGGINPMRYIPAPILQRRMDGDVHMMRDAYGPEKHQVTDAERRQAMEDLRLLGPELGQRYGEDVQIMLDPHNGVGKEKVACELVQYFWAQVLALPPAKAAGVIRLSLSAGMQ